MKIVISSGHGLHVRGAKGFIDEVDEARLVTDKVAQILNHANISADVFHENYARTQRDNLNAIIRHHNKHHRDLDVSIHFNAVAGVRDEGIGVEVCYAKGNEDMRIIASRIAGAISSASGLKLRRGDGSFPRADLGFLNNTNINKAVLIEVCFVNSREDVRLYQLHFDDICKGIARAVSGCELPQPPFASTVNISLARGEVTIPAENINGSWFWDVNLCDGRVARASLRDALESLGYGVSWDRETNTVTAVFDDFEKSILAQ